MVAILNEERLEFDPHFKRSDQGSSRQGLVFAAFEGFAFDILADCSSSSMFFPCVIDWNIPDRAQARKVTGYCR